MIKGLVLHENKLEAIVRSEMYRETIVVIYIEDFKMGRSIFPCGDGCDYVLTDEDSKLIMDKLAERKSIVEQWKYIKADMRRKS